MRAKWTEETIIKYVEEHDYIFIQFIKFNKVNSRILIKCRNEKHKSYEVNFNNFKNGKRCPMCAKEYNSACKKLNYQDVKKYIESFGYKLLSKEYINNSIKLDMICDKGHKCSISYGNFKNGHRCKECAEEHRGNSRRLTYEYVKEYIERFGYELLSKKYNNNSTKLLVKCSEGHVYETTFNNFKSGHRCSECSKTKRAENRTIWSKEKIIQFVNDNNYEFIEFVKFNKIESIIKVWCKNPNHKPYEVRFSSFHHGARCRKCADEKLSEIFSHDYEYVKNYIESFGHKLISTEYKNMDTEIEISCLNKSHGNYKTTFRLFKMLKYKCPKCANEHRGEYHKLNYEYVKNYIESFEYKLLSTEYKNAKTNMLVQCPDNHNPYFVSFDRFKRGDRCPYCNESRGEREIRGKLNEYNINFKPQHRFDDCKWYKTLPFDFYLPQYNICIEYDGEFHYKMIMGYDEFVNQKIRDVIKTIYCKNNNIKLIRIPYWEFDNIKNIIVKELNLK